MKKTYTIWSMHYHWRGLLLNFNLFPVSTNPKKSRRCCGLGGRRAWFGTPLGALCGKLWRMWWTLGKWKRWRKCWWKLKQWWWLFLISDDWWRKINGWWWWWWRRLWCCFWWCRCSSSCFSSSFLCVSFRCYCCRGCGRCCCCCTPGHSQPHDEGNSFMIVGKRYVAWYPGKIYTNHVKSYQV